MNTRTAALLVLAGLFAPAARAQTSPQDSPASVAFMDAGKGMSLEQAIARALAEEPLLRAAKSSIDAARALQHQAQLRKNPSVSMEYRGEPAGTDNQTTVGIQWPLDLFRRQARLSVAARETAVAELSTADRERVLAAEVRTRFGDVLVTVRDLATLEELVDAARRQYDLVRARVDEGASPALDRDLMEVEWHRLDAQRLLQLARAERTMFELKRSLALPPDSALRLRGTLEDQVTLESAPASVPLEPAVHRADVREAAARVALSDARIDRAQREGRFDVNVFGGYMRMDAGFPQFGVAADGGLERVRSVFHYVAAGAMVTMPLFNRNQGEITAGRAERAGAAAAHEAVRLTAQTEIASARRLDQRTRDAVRIYGGAVRTLARQNLSVVRQSYELGRTTILDVIAEQKRYLEQEREYTDILRQAYEARTTLKRALGDVQ